MKSSFLLEGFILSSKISFLVWGYYLFVGKLTATSKMEESSGPESPQTE